MTTSASALLDWQHSRRAQGLPTITVFVGPETLGVREWRTWNSQHQRRIAVGSRLELAVREGFDSLDLTAMAASWLADKIGSQPVPESMTIYDLDQLWRDLPNANTDPVAAVAYHLLNAKIRRQATDVAGAPSLAGLCGLVPESSWPALMVIANERDDFVKSMADLERLALQIPRLPTSICVPKVAYELAVASATRTMSLAREGEIFLAGLSVEALTGRLQAVGVAEPLPVESIRHLATVGVAAEVAELFVEAAAAVGKEESLHRSASEKFLFEQLESMPQTVGLFLPNEYLEFLHGTRRAEADLVAPALKLVIEVDGGYYHLKPDQYRSDRRKDNAYQQHGYWVLRFLAEDIVADLENILDTITKAVAIRRPTRPS